MIVEVIHRDGHKQLILTGSKVTLAEVVKLAYRVYPKALVRKAKIVKPKCQEVPRDPA